MNREKILLEVLNEHGDFENVRQQFNENDLDVITESMLRFAKLGQSLPIDSVSKRFSIKQAQELFFAGYFHQPMDNLDKKETEEGLNKEFLKTVERGGY